MLQDVSILLKVLRFILKIWRKALQYIFLNFLCIQNFVRAVFFKDTTRCFAHNGVNLKLQWLSVFVEV